MVRLDLNIKPADKIHCFKSLDISSLGIVLWNNYKYCIYPVQYSLLYFQSVIPHILCLDFIHDFHYLQLWKPHLLHVQRLLL